jgi:hypothetical protein
MMLKRAVVENKVVGGTGRLLSLGRWVALLAGSEKQGDELRATDPSAEFKPQPMSPLWSLNGPRTEVHAVQLHNIHRCHRLRRLLSDALFKILMHWLHWVL